MLHNRSPDAAHLFHEAFDKRRCFAGVADLVRSVLEAAKVQDPKKQLFDLLSADRLL